MRNLPHSTNQWCNFITHSVRDKLAHLHGWPGLLWSSQKCLRVALRKALLVSPPLLPRSRCLKSKLSDTLTWNWDIRGTQRMNPSDLVDSLCHHEADIMFVVKCPDDYEVV